MGGCSDPMFEYEKDYLIGGFQRREALIVEKKGFVADCQYTKVLGPMQESVISKSFRKFSRKDMS